MAYCLPSSLSWKASVSSLPGQSNSPTDCPPISHPFLHPFPSAFISSGFQGLLVIFLHLSLFCCILALLLPSESYSVEGAAGWFQHDVQAWRPVFFYQALWVLKCFIRLQCYGPLRSKSPTFLAASQSHPHHSSRDKWTAWPQEKKKIQKNAEPNIMHTQYIQ